MISYAGILLAYGDIAGWTTTTPANLYLINGEESGFPNPALINTQQYIRISRQGNIQQVINNLPAGVYELSFKYGFYLNKVANPISIYFDGVVIETLPTYYNGDTSVENFISNPTKDTSLKYSWYSYTKSITVRTAGNKTLKFEGILVYAFNRKTRI